MDLLYKYASCHVFNSQTASKIVSAEAVFALSTGFMTNACQYPILALYYFIATMYLGRLT